MLWLRCNRGLRGERRGVCMLMPVVAVGLLALAALAAIPIGYRIRRERQSQARRQRRYRRIGFQRAWNWLMAPRVARLTDQRESAE